jgi:hypothetical protein
VDFAKLRLNLLDLHFHLPHLGLKILMELVQSAANSLVLLPRTI